MLREFLRDGIVYGLTKVITGAVVFLALPVYTHALAPGEYGVLDLLATLANAVHVTVALEIAQGLGRYINAPDKAGARVRYASTALWFTLLTYGLFTLCVMPFAPAISCRLFGSIAHANVVRLASVAAFTTGTFYLVQNLLRFDGRALQFAIVSVTFSCLSVGLAVILLRSPTRGVSAVFIGQAIAGLAAAMLGIWYARAVVMAQFDRQRCREMLTFSLPLVPSGVGVLLSQYVDRFAIVRLLSIAELGRYAVAFRLAAVVPMTLAGFQLAVSPLIFQNYLKPETPAHIARLFQWFLAVALPVILLLGLFAKELVHLIAPAEYGPAAPLVATLGASMVLANIYIFSPGLWITKRTGGIALISVGSGAANLVLNYLLIPHLGLMGAAVATLLSASCGAIAHVVVSQRLYPVPFDWRRGCAAVGVVAAGIMSVTVLHLGVVVRILMWVMLAASTSVALIGARDLRRLTSAVGRVIVARTTT